MKSSPVGWSLVETWRINDRKQTSFCIAIEQVVFPCFSITYALLSDEASRISRSLTI